MILKGNILITYRIIKCYLFRAIKPCTLVKVDQYFGGICCPIFKAQNGGDMFNFYQNTRRYIIEDESPITTTVRTSSNIRAHYLNQLSSGAATSHCNDS
jgi:hypothetical protein